MAETATGLAMTDVIDDFLAAEEFTRVPYRVYTDPALYEAEQQGLFRGSVWNFVGLELEVPKVGDYQTRFIGDTSVVMVRAEEGINVLVNRCAHRGNLVCFKNSGNAKHLACVYHNWTYGLDGKLQGVPFRRGVGGKGGMPEDFNTADHAMPRLRAESYCGLVFATFSDTAPSLHDYLGESMRANMERVLGRKLTVLGYYVQAMPNNWKLYVENNRDPYHASLLHLFQATFKLNRLSMEGGIKLSDDGKHHISYSISAKDTDEAEYAADKLRSVSDGYTLNDPSLIAKWPEFACGTTLAIQTIFPNFVVQQISNSLAVRLCLSKGPEQCELLWWILGTEEDTKEQRDIRIRQSNMVGPGGVISMEDGVVGGWIQRATREDKDERSLVEMGGRDFTPIPNNRVTEVAVRSYWRAWRDCVANFYKKGGAYGKLSGTAKAAP